jgi:hypothetical protein
MTMKLFRLLAVAAVFATPIASFAQSNSPVTRQSVREELVQLEQAGYNQASDQTQYPRNIEAAEARLHAGTSDAGAPNAAKVSPGLGSLYAHR